jgi:hypothetical protein
MRTFALAVIFLLACSKPAPVAERVEASAPVAVRSFARFDKGQLTQCIDVIGEGSTQKLEDALRDEQPISQPCAKAFADRVNLATCVLDIPTDAGVVKLALSHYDFGAVGLTDVSMSECLAQSGAWKPIPRDSAPFRRAQLEHAQRR